MYVSKLSFERFRNLCAFTLFPETGMNVIYGENAQGKTNLLEGIWLFTGGHSFRGAKDTELTYICPENGQHVPEAYLEADFFSEERMQNASLKLVSGKRSTVINGVYRNSGTALVGKIRAVIFSPEHLTLIKGGPGKRRAFIDGAICQIQPLYAKTLHAYNRSLQQRNALLKNYARSQTDQSTIGIWNARLSQYGALVVQARKHYASMLNISAIGFYEGISGNREAICISYISDISTGQKDETDIAGYENLLLRRLEENEKRDIKNGFTSVGPHRDDLEIQVNGVSLRTYGSQGQQRSAVLAMKLSESAILSERYGEPPIILLDDVMSELDSNRQDYLLNHLSDKQVFITCCSPDTMKGLRSGAAHRVENGCIYSEKSQRI